MKKTYILPILALIVIASMAMVSASTIVAGKVYNSDYSIKVIGADVNATCTHNGTDITKPTVSSGDTGNEGSYVIEFTNEECGLGDTIYVTGFHSSYGSDVGDGTTINVNMAPLDVKLGVSNIALIPEFGMVIGGLTLISAIGIFFFVRRR